MNISGIGTYSGNYNFIKLNRSANQQASGVTPAGQSQQARGEDSAIRRQEQQKIRANQNFNSADYAKQFAPGKTYEMKGADSELASLDESKGVTGSQKSQIMQQYQLFMGETQAQGVNQAAMNTQAVRGVENFAF